MKKKFDCVEMMHRGGEHVQELVAGMTLEEEVEFWRREMAVLRKEQEEARARLEKAGRG